MDPFVPSLFILEYNLLPANISLPAMRSKLKFLSCTDASVLRQSNKTLLLIVFLPLTMFVEPYQEVDFFDGVCFETGFLEIQLALNSLCSRG